MVKDHSDSERGNPLPPHGLLFLISSKGSFIWWLFELKCRSTPPIEAPCGNNPGSGTWLRGRAFAHGVVGRRIDPSWGGPIELFLIPATAPRQV